MNRKDLGPVLTAGQLSEVRALLRQLQRSGSLLELAKPSVAALLRAIDVENDGTTVLVETPRIDETGDIAIPDEVVDLRLLLDCRRERDEALAEVERLNAECDSLAHQLNRCNERGGEMRRLLVWAESLIRYLSGWPEHHSNEVVDWKEDWRKVREGK